MSNTSVQNTIPHRAIIKWAGQWIKQINESIDDPNFNFDQWISEPKWASLSIKYLSLISPQLPPFGPGFHLMFLIAKGKFEGFGRSQSKVVTDLETDLVKEAHLTMQALQKMIKTPACNDYFSFRIGYFCQRFIKYTGFLAYWENLKYQIIVQWQIEDYWTQKVQLDQYKKKLEEGPDSELEKGIKTFQSKLDSAYQNLVDLGVEKEIEKFKPLKIDYDQIEKTFHQAFWDQLKSDLSQSPPDYLRVADLMDEMKQMIMACYPSRNDKHFEISESLDSELIRQMIKHKAINAKDIKKMTFYTLDRIKEVQRPVDDAQWTEWHQEIEKQFSGYDQLKSAEGIGIFWANFFPKTFKKIFGRLKEIHQEIAEFKETEEYKHLHQVKSQQTKTE